MTASIRGRFAFTLGANLLRALLSFLTGLLLARWLGPKTYGSMAFLLGTFLAARQLLDLGSSSAFFTFLSQRPRSRRFVGAFFAWLIGQFLIPLFVIGVIFPSRWVETIWHGETRGLVLLAFAAAFMQNSVWPVVQQTGESQRRTIRVQGIGVAIGILHLIAVVMLKYFGALALSIVFAAIAVEYLLAAVIAQKGFPYAPAAETDGMMFRKYWDYCFSLILYSLLSFAYDFADRWLLQNYGGSVEQAYYAVSAQFAAVALIATTSILRIFWKEVAEAHAQNDHARAGQLYQKVSRLLFLVGAIVAGFLVPWSTDLLGLLLGSAYVGGAATLAIMLLYPVHQSMGQIGGTLLLATERVGWQVGIGVAFMLVSMVATYFVLAPRDLAIPGLGLAAEGLAIKMCAMQVLHVNLQAYLIARLWQWPFDWLHQPVSLLGCLGLGWAAYAATSWLCDHPWPLLARMTMGGVLYLIMLSGFIYALPWQAGLKRAELRNDIARAWDGGLRLLGFKRKRGLP